MHESGRLERLPGHFLGHLVRGQATQLLVNEWQQGLRRSRIALLHRDDESRRIPVAIRVVFWAHCSIQHILAEEC